jgi:cytochrome c553
MRGFPGFALLVLTPFVAATVVAAQYRQPTPPGQPAWAYAVPAADAVLAPEAWDRPEANTVFTLPGSDKSYTPTQAWNFFGPVDWYPEDHPPMPDIVAKGRVEANIRKCSQCHYPTGRGRPENSSVSGLPVVYFIQQLQDMKNGLRKTSDPYKTNPDYCISYSKILTEQEISEAAEYFGSIKWTTPYIRVVETNTVPKTRVQRIHLPLEGAAAGTEPIGQRIIETPEHNRDYELLRNPRDGFVAYAPVGSIKKGEALVQTGGNGKTVACVGCHGADLLGLGPVPAIAGRSPSVQVRALWDMKQGTRRGLWSELHKPVAQNLNAEDMLNIAAYTASRPVVAGPTSSRESGDR